MIICPNCQNRNMLGAIFCQECGVQLVYGDGEIVASETSQPDTPAGDETNFAAPAPEPVAPAMPGDSKIALYIPETNDILPLVDREEVTLGRAIEGQPIIPDLDLTPYNGYKKGISRLHASIKIGADHVTVMDLGSANGTQVNGIKLTPNQPQEIAHGDILTLGKLITQVVIRA